MGAMPGGGRSRLILRVLMRAVDRQSLALPRRPQREGAGDSNLASFASFARGSWDVWVPWSSSEYTRKNLLIPPLEAVPLSRRLARGLPRTRCFPGRDPRPPPHLVHLDAHGQDSGEPYIIASLLFLTRIRCIHKTNV
jgi:hypothetical protein